jgi:hypothetical protein
MQTRRQTLNEVVLSTAAAFLLSAMLQHWVVNPIWHLESSMLDSIGITVFFTLVSLVRSYWIRRFFNWYHNRSTT